MTNSYVTLTKYTPTLNSNYKMRSFFETNVDGTKAMEIFQYLFSESVKNFKGGFPQFSHLSDTAFDVQITLLKSV